MKYLSEYNTMYILNTLKILTFKIKLIISYIISKIIISFLISYEFFFDHYLSTTLIHVIIYTAPTLWYKINDNNYSRSLTQELNKNNINY